MLLQAPWLRADIGQIPTGYHREHIVSQSKNFHTIFDSHLLNSVISFKVSDSTQQWYHLQLLFLLLTHEIKMHLKALQRMDLQNVDCGLALPWETVLICHINLWGYFHDNFFTIIWRKWEGKFLNMIQFKDCNCLGGSSKH